MILGMNGAQKNCLSNFRVLSHRLEENMWMPLNILIAINYVGMYLLDQQTRKTLDHYVYSSILAWSSNSHRLKIKVKLNQTTTAVAGMSSATLRFNTHNPRIGKEMCDLLLTYAKELIK